MPRFMRCIFLAVLLGWVAALSLGGPAASQEQGSELLCDAQGQCWIPYGRLSTQETDPFLFLGRVVDKDHPRWETHGRAIQRYADVRQCLVQSEREKETPNLLKIDWNEVGFGRGAEVCVFRIAKSLGTFEGMRAWLIHHEFELTDLHRVVSDKFQPSYPTEPVSNFSAYWSAEQYRVHNPSWLRSLTGFDLVLRFEIVISYSDADIITGVGVVIPSK